MVTLQVLTKYMPLNVAIAPLDGIRQWPVITICLNKDVNSTQVGYTKIQIWKQNV